MALLFLRLNLQLILMSRKCQLDCMGYWFEKISFSDLKFKLFLHQIITFRTTKSILNNFLISFDKGFITKINDQPIWILLNNMLLARGVFRTVSIIFIKAFFAKIINVWMQQTIFAKKLHHKRVTRFYICHCLCSKTLTVKYQIFRAVLQYQKKTLP